MKVDTINNLEIKDVLIEVKKDSIRIKNNTKIKKFFGRAFSSKEKINSLDFIKKSLNLKKGLNNISKEDLINFISSK
jgi:hypothetical protein